MSTSAAVPSLLDIMKSPEFTGPEVLDQRAFHIRTVIKSGKHGKVALCEHGSNNEVAIKSELIKSPNNPFSRPYREYFILKQLSTLVHKPEYYENPRWIGFIQLLDWFKAKTDQIRITSAPASPIKTPTRLTGHRNVGSPTTPTSGSNRSNITPIASKTAPKSITAVSKLAYGDENENVDSVEGPLSNLQLTPSAKRARVSATPTPKRIIPRTPLLQTQSSPLRQREIKLQEGNLVLEKADTTLYAIRGDLSFEVFRDVLFQIIYALHVSQTEFEFVHHDLHIQNVLLKRLKVQLEDYMIESTDSSGLIKCEVVDEERLVEENCGVFKDGETTWYSRGPWIVKLSDFGLSRIKMVDDDGRVVYDLTQPLAEAFLGDKDVLKILDEFSRAKITRWLTRAECVQCGAVVDSIKEECFVGPEAAISLEDAQSVLQSSEAVEAMERLVESKRQAVRQVRATIRKNALHVRNILHHEFFDSLRVKPSHMLLFGRENGGEATDDLDGSARSPTRSLRSVPRVSITTVPASPLSTSTTPSRLSSSHTPPHATAVAATRNSTAKKSKSALKNSSTASSLASSFAEAALTATDDDDTAQASAADAHELLLNETSSLDLDFGADLELAPLSLPVKRLTFEEAFVESPVKVEIVEKKAVGSKKKNAAQLDAKVGTVASAPPAKRPVQASPARSTSKSSSTLLSSSLSSLSTLQLPTSPAATRSATSVSESEEGEIDICSITPPTSPHSSASATTGEELEKTHHDEIILNDKLAPSSSSLDDDSSLVASSTDEVSAAAATGDNAVDENAAPARRSARVSARVAARGSSASAAKLVTTPTKPSTRSSTTPRRAAALVKPDPVAIAKALETPVSEDSTKYANKAKTPTPVKKAPSSTTPSSSLNNNSSRKAPSSARRQTILPSQFASLSTSFSDIADVSSTPSSNDHQVINSMRESLADLSIEPSAILSRQNAASFAIASLVAVQAPAMAVEEVAITRYDPVPARWLGEPLILPMLQDAPTDCIEAVRDYLMRQAQKWEETRHKRRPFNISRFFVRNEQEIQEARVLKLQKLRKKKPTRRSLGGLGSRSRTGLEKAVAESNRSRRKSMSAAGTSEGEQNGSMDTGIEVTERILEVVSEALESKLDDVSVGTSDEDHVASSSEIIVHPASEKPKSRAVSHLEANGLGLLTSPTAPRRSARRRSSLVASPLSTPVPVFSLHKESGMPASSLKSVAVTKSNSVPTSRITAPSSLPVSPKRSTTTSAKSTAIARTAKATTAASEPAPRPPTPVKTSSRASSSTASSTSSSPSNASSIARKSTVKTPSTKVMRV